MRCLIISLLVCACSSAHEQHDSGTEAGEPIRRLDQCFVGYFFADCSGDGAPTFACDEERRCRWFANANVVDTYDSSTCPSESLCCEESWPFTDARYGVTLYRQIYAWGLQPWNRTRSAVLSVELGERLPRAAGRVECDPLSEIRPPGPCEDNPPRSGSVLDTTTIFIEPSTGSAGWRLAIEVVPTDSGHRARACKLPFTDRLATTCLGIDEPDCASSGTITLDALPTQDEDIPSTRINARLEFADGGWVNVDL